MRKYIHITAVVFALLAVTATSCKKDFLEIVPKGKLVATTYDDYNLLMNSSDFYIFGNQGIWQAAMLMGDDVSAEENLFNGSTLLLANQLFSYDADIFVPTSNPYSLSSNPLFFSRILQNMYEINKIINEVNASSGGTAQLKQEVRAEAMVTRAYTHFQLVNYFAKPYAAATASTDPGFPIITVADITQTDFPRGTVQDSYNFMIKDITTALPDLNIQPGFPTRWSKPAAEALLGKIYLFMGKNSDALAMFNAAFSDIAKMTTKPGLYNYNQTFAPGGSFLPINATTGPKAPSTNFTDMTESVVSVFSFSGAWNGSVFGNDFLTIDPKTLALFDASDFRLKFFTNLQFNGSPIAGGRVRRYGAQFSSASYARIGIELSELYLLSAEAKARTNDLPGAKSDVETLRQNRMPATNASVPAAIAGNQLALIKFIIDERTREFTATGYRWWDMRRLSVDPLFSGQPLPAHTLFLTAGGTTQIPLTQARLTLRIPLIYVTANPGMVNNP